MRVTPLYLVILVFLSLSLSGCVTAQKQGLENQRLEPSAKLKFSDIPTPAGFRILSTKSFILESGGIRAGVLKYSGRADADSVVRFYKAQMPIYNWALLNVLEYGDRMLNFERENESCVVSIKSKGSRVEVSISIAPKSPMPAPAPAKVIDISNISIGEQKRRK